MRLVSRRTALFGLASGAAALVAACSPDPATEDSPGPDAPETAEPSPETEPEPAHRIIALDAISETVIADDDALALSRAVLETATAVVVLQLPSEPTPSPTPEGSPTAESSPSPEGSPAPSAAPSEDTTASPGGDVVAAAVAAAESLGVPVLVAGPDLIAELDRLQTRTVIAFPTTDLEVGDREVLADGEQSELDGLPLSPEAHDVIAVSLPEETVSPILAATLAAVGIESATMAEADPRATGETVQLVKDAAAVLGVGVGFGEGERFASRVQAARTLPELPGGGVVPFPGRMMVALYGHPSGPTLGLLGEQGPEASVDRVKTYVEQYQQLTDKPVIGCFEIITTVASASAGADGNYSSRTPIEQLRPLIEVAAENDIYCVLDLQPGYNTFLSQAQLYEELLLQPHVGLALDPEWRIVPPQRHMTIIGQVHADEINATGAWLAELVRENQLPPKVLVLHQFQTRMIVDREKIDTNLDDIQYLMHADGHGTHGQKLETWRALRTGLSDDIRLGWKNFIDEDAPMMTVQQTMTMVDPVPDFVSYQ